MNKLFKELRRREVFRTAGLYVGICWLVIEVASVILPIFDAPEWLLRGAFVAAVAGFPIMLVLAWFFDVTAAGISLQGDEADAPAEASGAGKTDFAIIGVLALALVVSLSLNFKNQTSKPANAALEPVSVLVANFENTVDDAFENVLEEALVVGLEVAPHVTALDRNRARQIAAQINPDVASLNLSLARQVAQREGVKMILTGSLQQTENEYRVRVEGIDVADGRSAFMIDEEVDSRDAVLQAIGEIAIEAREELGDDDEGDPQDTQSRTFEVASLEAAGAYAAAGQLENNGMLEEAAEFYRKATVADPNFGRAFSALAFTQFALGQTDEAATYWAKAQSLMGTLTEREQLRALGRYATAVAHDNDEAVGVYARLVSKYPAEVRARERYAAASVRQLDFATAAAQMRSNLQIFPTDNRYRSSLALYSMYAGEWETAKSEAEKVIAADPQFAAAYLPVAMTALAQGQRDAARDAYQRMAAAGKTGHGASVAELGLADMELYFGQVDAAQARLTTGVEAGANGGNQRMSVLQGIALAQSYADQGDLQAATATASNALSLIDDTASNVAAAIIYIRSGDLASANEIAGALARQADAHGRAYGQMLKGMMLENKGAQTEAILAMRDGIDIADLWLIRYQIGKAYLRAGKYLEALDELTTLKLRRGEAAAVFLDDMPTYRLLAELPYWTGRAQEALKMQPAARASYEDFIALRPQGGQLAQDASERAANLD